MKYTEHEKLKEKRCMPLVEQSQQLGSFLDWLFEEKGVRLAVYTKPRVKSAEEKLVPWQFHMKEVIAEFLGIDIDRMEEERKHMLDMLGIEDKGQG